jgi:hypothetical protein
MPNTYVSAIPVNAISTAHLKSSGCSCGHRTVWVALAPLLPRHDAGVSIGARSAKILPADERNGSRDRQLGRRSRWLGIGRLAEASAKGEWRRPRARARPMRNVIDQYSVLYCI